MLFLCSSILCFKLLLTTPSNSDIVASWIEAYEVGMSYARVIFFYSAFVFVVVFPFRRK